MNIPKVFDIQKFSVHDGPGIRTIIFLKGCPLHCWWCANPESQLAREEVMIHKDKCIGCGKCTEVCSHVFDLNSLESRQVSGCTGCGNCTNVCASGARVLIGSEMSVEEVIKEANKDLVFYQQSGGGITFSGGEAAMYPEYVAAIASDFKKRNISTAIETCGAVPWQNYEKIIDYLDLVMFDIKIMDAKAHKRYTGQTNERILDNLKRISEKVETIVRMPIIPTVNDSLANIDATGEFIKSLCGNIKYMNILPYHNYGLSKYYGLGRDYLLKDVRIPEQEQMEAIKARLEKYGIEVQIGG